MNYDIFDTGDIKPTTGAPGNIYPVENTGTVTPKQIDYGIFSKENMPTAFTPSGPDPLGLI